MQRRVEVTVPPEQTDALLREIRGMDGLLTLQVERGISEHPKGDLVSVEALTRTYLDIVSLLERRGIGKSSSSSVSISETKAVISPTVKRALAQESDASAWEQIDAVIAKASDMTLYALVTMFVAGMIAAVGISTGALHVAVGAFIIAPGFEPIVRVPLGLVVKPGTRVKRQRDSVDSCFGLPFTRHGVSFIAMKLRFRFLAALFALTALVLFQVEGLWASSACSAEGEMTPASQVADAHSHADACATGHSGSSHEHGGKGPQDPACPLMPGGAASCAGAIALLPSSEEPALGVSEDELARSSPDHAKDLLLAVSLLRPPRA